MNVKVKITVIILLTLIIGMVLGALLNRALLQHRIERAFAWRNPAFLARSIEGVLALDEEQSAGIQKILKDHAATVERIRENSTAEMRTAVEALNEALTPLLTPDQKKRLRRKPFGPFGFRPPGRDPRRGSRGYPGSIPDLQFWTDQLELSQDQVIRLEELLPRPQPPFGMGPRDIQGIERTLHVWKNWQNDLDKSMAEVLTEAQKEKYARLKKDQQKRLAEILHQD